MSYQLYCAWSDRERCVCTKVHQNDDVVNQRDACYFDDKSHAQT